MGLPGRSTEVPRYGVGHSLSDTPQKPVVEFEHICKRFPGVQALNDVSLTVYEGSCHGLVGENGAGKSTLGKVLVGICRPDEGRVLISGKPVSINSSKAALDYGIGMVYQELAFCENMTVAENLSLGQMPKKGVFVDRKRMLQVAREKLSQVGVEMDVERRLGELTVGQQQLVQIASAVSRGARVIVFDEPTSSLSQPEAETLFLLIRDLKAQGVTCIYVSHRLSEIFELCDRVSVLRDGALVDTLDIGELDEDRLVSLMVGKVAHTMNAGETDVKMEKELLRVENLSRAGKFEDVSFTLHAGEILGVCGLVGSGRTEVAEAIFGLCGDVCGEVYVDGKRLDPNKGVRDAMRSGLGLVPEDRKRHGLVLQMKARENITLPILWDFATLGYVDERREDALALDYFDKMDIRATGTDAVVAGLSGGNQQKVVLARWLAADCRVLIVDEPTRGVDVGAKAQIHDMLISLAKAGNAILCISSELPEAIAVSTRIVVMKNGRIVGELQKEEFDEERVMRLMSGVKNEVGAS